MQQSDYVRGVFESLQKMSDEYVRSSNTEYSDLSKHIALFSSIILPLVGIFITSDKYLSVATCYTDVAAFLVVFSLCLSLFLGFISYVRLGEFFLKLSNETSEAQTKLSSKEFTSPEEEWAFVDNLYSSLSKDEDSGSYIMWASLLCVTTALVAFVYLIFKILF